MNKAVAYPYLVWMVLFTLVPLVLVLTYALTVASPDGGLAFTLVHVKRAFEPLYINVMWRSVVLAFFATLICLLLGYPAAYIMADRKLDTRSTLMFLFLVPMWMNFLLRTYSWLTILEQNGLINTLLASVGLPKLNFLYTPQAVVLGMVYNFLPFMILPIYTVLKKMDLSLVEAAQDLGAHHGQVFWRVVLPLSIPGVLSGVSMVFMPAVTTFIIPNLLGGGKELLIGSLIEQQFLRVGDWHFGSALSIVLMVMILISMAFMNAVDQNGEGGGLF